MVPQTGYGRLLENIMIREEAKVDHRVNKWEKDMHLQLVNLELKSIIFCHISGQIKMKSNYMIQTIKWGSKIRTTGDGGQD